MSNHDSSGFLSSRQDLDEFGIVYLVKYDDYGALTADMILGMTFIISRCPINPVITVVLEAHAHHYFEPHNESFMADSPKF